MNTRMFYISKQNLLKFIGFGATATIVLKIISTQFTTSAFHRSKSAFADQYDRPSSFEKLVSVQLITRHGARTPLHLVPGIEEAEYTPDLLETHVKAKVALRTLGRTPVVNEISFYDEMNLKRKLKGGASTGMLTTVGERQMFDLGRRLRERYIKEHKFLPENYDPDVIYARSSHFMRTIRSAKCVLAGLFTEPNDSSAEFIIHAHRNEDDWIFPNTLSCPLFNHIYENQHKLPLLETPDFVLQLEELRKHVGPDAKGEFLSYTDFRDDLIARQTHNKPIPDDLLKFMDKADYLSGVELAAVFEHNIQVSIGLFLNLILGNLQKAISKDSMPTLEDVKDHRFIYYSAHDSTIGAVLVALNKDNKNKLNYHWPPFSADIQIELWKNEQLSDYYVRVFYLGKALRLSQCNTGFTDETKCDLKKFIQLMKKSSVDKSTFDKICNQSIEHYKLDAK